MKKLLIYVLSIIGISTYAQVAINTDGSQAHSSAILDIKSSNKGVLIPRTDTNTVNSAGIPATGLIIYQTSDKKFYFFNGVKWTVITVGTDPVFERNGNTIRQIANYNDNFVLDRNAIPQNSETITDTLLYYNATKGAFRFGILNNSQNWAPNNTGLASLSFGFNTKAMGDYSSAWGFNTTASGALSTAWGAGTSATGLRSTAWGSSSKASGNYSTVWGQDTEASGGTSTAWGTNTTASGTHSTAWGDNVSALSAYETALGRFTSIYTPNSSNNWYDNDRLFVIGNGKDKYNRTNALMLMKNGDFLLDMDSIPLNNVLINDDFLFFNAEKYALRFGKLNNSDSWSPVNTGNGSFAFGLNTKAQGAYSTAWGENTVAASGFETVLGRYNNIYIPKSDSSWNQNDRLFVIGNGNSATDRNNALTLIKNGNFLLDMDSVPPNGVNFTDTSLYYNAEKGSLRFGAIHHSPNWSPENIGVGSFAFGFTPRASGRFSTAWGYYSVASGFLSTVWGEFNEAPSGLETVFGRYCAPYTPQNANGWNDNDRLFVIGNGSNNYNRNNALTLIKNGDFFLNWNNKIEWLEDITGHFLYYNNERYALRFGKLETSSAWSGDKVGFGSFAYGLNTLASGMYSTAWGEYAKATSYHATAWGKNTLANHNYATAWGENTTASEDYATAWGLRTTASAMYATAWGIDTKAVTVHSTAWGTSTEASGSKATAWGDETKASGGLATAWGDETKASGSWATAWGDGTEASGDWATAWGYYTDAPSAYETVLGCFNVKYTPNDPDGWDENDRLFVIANGIGYGSDNRSNAVTILKNGKIGIGDVTIPGLSLQLPNNPATGTAQAYQWVTYSDARIKSNQKEINYGLKEIMALKPKSYIHHPSKRINDKIFIDKFKGDKTIGLIAQEVNKIIPEAVLIPVDEKQSLWGIDYEKLIPVLIKGMQEQQKIIEKLTQRIEKLEKMK